MLPGQARTLLGWITSIPAPRMHANPTLEIIHASALMFTNQLDAAEATLQAAERLAVAAIPAVRASGNPFTFLRSMTNLARLQVLQGRLRIAAATYREAAHTAAGPGGLRVLIGSPAYYLGMGDLLREWNDLDSAEQHLAQGMEIIQETLAVDAEDVSLGYLALARLQEARGDQRGARATVDAFADLARRRGFAPHLAARGAAIQAQLALSHGRLGTAGEWADASGLGYDDEVDYPREMEYLALARVRIAQARAEKGAPLARHVLRLLDRLLVDARAKARLGSAVEILILQALAFQAQGDIHASRDALERALDLAAPEGYIRRFVDEGAPMAELVAQIAQRRAPNDPHSGYVERLLNALPETDKQTSRQADKQTGQKPTSPFSQSPGLPVSLSLQEPLTEREREVLRLIAEGNSNTEIARRLVIAVGTVKAHINNIFSKLCVASRTQAAAKAHDLHLL
jgi:LuxR family maltose regulon positive regulatory protein